jgi:hypothetical protein
MRIVTITKNFGANRPGHVCALTDEEYDRAVKVGAAELVSDGGGQAEPQAESAAEALFPDSGAAEDDAGDIPLAGLTDEENAARAAASSKKPKKPKS